MATGASEAELREAVLAGWHQLETRVATDDDRLAALAKLTGMSFRQLDMVRRVRNEIAHPGDPVGRDRLLAALRIIASAEEQLRDRGRTRNNRRQPDARRPARDQPEPAGARAKPRGGQAKSTGDRAKSATDRAKSVGGRGKSASDRGKPPRGQTKPASSRAKPSRGRAKSANDRAKSPRGRAKPASGRRKPPRGGAQRRVAVVMVGSLVLVAAVVGVLLLLN